MDKSLKTATLQGEEQIEHLLGEEYEHEPVPAAARRSAFSVTLVWLGFPMIITGAMTGSLLVLGMGFKSALVAMIIGNIIMFAYVGALGLLGTKRGMNFALIASIVFGKKGYVLASGLRFFCKYYSADFGRPILIAENGIALRRRANNEYFPRRDRLTRSDFLRAHVHEVEQMVEEGVPVFGYLHWSLFDNYEWGSFTPRFGLYSLDYTKGADRLPVDPLGDCASQTYAKLVKNARGKIRA